MQLDKAKKDIKNFLHSAYFADGIRITMGVLLPSLILAQFALLKIGITLSLGALCVSIADSPGPIIHRRNAMLITSVLIFLCSFITGVSNQNHPFIALVILISSFVFSMLYCYGVRAASIGTASLLIIILGIDDRRSWHEEITYSLLILTGGLWYAALSYLVYRVRPFRAVQQVLSDSILEVSGYLAKKASLFNPNTDFETAFSELIKLQVNVHEKQNAVRDLLFRTRSLVRDSSAEGRFLLAVFIDMVDLFERIMATHYDYKILQQKFGKTDVFSDYERLIKAICVELDDIAESLKEGRPPLLNKELLEEFKITKTHLKEQILEKGIANADDLAFKSLNKIEQNIERIFYQVETMGKYFKTRTSSSLKKPDIDTNKFIDRGQFGIDVFLQNLTLKSSTFKHSLRVTVVMVIGFFISILLPFHHSYWILLTILVICKPGFSLTKQRNYQRVIGTTVGAIFGMIVISYVSNSYGLFIILLICMIGCYSFQRKNYVISVVFMTPYILLLYRFLGLGTLTVASERIYDTLIGSGIALAASYFLFPSWEKDSLKEAMLDMLRANKNYFSELAKTKTIKDNDKGDYKVARKQVYVASANLSTSFQRMFSEPKSKQIYMSQLYQFTVLNHLFSSSVASLSLLNMDDLAAGGLEELLSAEQYSKSFLELSIEHLNPQADDNKMRTTADLIDHDDFKTQTSAQFDGIQKTAFDIYKLSNQFKFN